MGLPKSEQIREEDKRPSGLGASGLASRGAVLASDGLYGPKDKRLGLVDCQREADAHVLADALGDRLEHKMASAAQDSDHGLFAAARRPSLRLGLQKTLRALRLVRHAHQ